MLPAFVFASVVGVVLALVDVRRRLPYLLSVPVYGVSAALFVAQSIIDSGFGQLGRAMAAGLLVLVAFLVLALAVPGQLGLGDVVLVGWIAMLGWFGWDRLVPALPLVSCCRPPLSLVC